MIQGIIHRLFRRRHYWRIASFEEVAELYASRLMTIFATNIVSLFAAVYLYKLGYSLLFIAIFYGASYALKLFLAYPSARFVAFFGPKHAILWSNIMKIPALGVFLFVEQWGLPSIILMGAFQQISTTLYNIAYMVDFSKIKNATHSGKEIGIMQILERVARIVSPIIGGVIASVYSPQVTIALAAVVFLVAAWPLFRTVEPTLTRARVKFEAFPWRLAWRSFVTESGTGFDFVTSGLVWNLFLTSVVLATVGDGIYAAIGGLASIGVATALIASWTFGQLVDRHRGALLLTTGTLVNVVNHVARPFVNSGVGVAGVNVASEVGTAAYLIAFMRGAFDIADTSGHRIAYAMFLELALDIGLVIACTVLVALLLVFGDTLGLQLMFFVAAAYELTIITMRRDLR